MSKRFEHSYYIWDDASLQWNECDYATYLAYKKEHKDAPVKNIPDYPCYFHFIG